MEHKEFIEDQKKGGLRLLFNGDGPISEEIYLILEELDINTAGEVSAYLNKSGYANMTVCPECRVDDFVHVESCKLNRFNPKEDE